jgi:ABC-type Fe3+-siderophore transport system permease subunit
MNTVRKGFSYIFKEIFSKPVESPNVSPTLIKIVWGIRIFTFIFGLLEIATGQVHIGVIILICVLLLVVPSFFTQSRVNDIPIEIEFLLFIIIFFQYIVGEAQGLYGSIEYYDDITHFLFPFIISVIGFTVAYALFKAGKLKVSTGAMILIVIIITLGIGAIWEIIEYANDRLLVPHIDGWKRVQGTNPANANEDTMTDLIHDLLGGVAGALIASRYILEAKYNKRFNELLKEITHHFFNHKEVNKD